MQYTISGREKPKNETILSYLGRVYGQVPFEEVESIFAFVERSTLYGGRRFASPELSPLDIQIMYDHGIGYRIPLTNHYVEPEEYDQNMGLLEKYHRTGNSVIIVNDNLAHWIRRDFPKYRVEASIIKNITSYDKIDEALELYDTVVLPTSLNEDLDFLGAIKAKERITLFAFAGCGVNCPAKICYPNISKCNKYTGYNEFKCSQPLKKREIRGKVVFDLDEYVKMGFNRFKMIEASARVTDRV